MAIGLNTAQIIDRARQMGRNISEAEAQSILSSAWDQSQYGADEGKVMSLLGGGGSSPAINTREEYTNSIVSEFQSLMDKYTSRSKEFESSNPFNFDELQAKASSEEQYNPYYDAELKDYMLGAERQRQSKEGEKQLLLDLNRIQAGAEKRGLDEAIKASEEGYAGAGLYFSGEKERATGLTQIEGAETAKKRELGLGYNMANIGRSLDQLGTETGTYKRRLGAEKTTNIQQDIERQKAEERSRWETEKQQYIGYPYISSSQGLGTLLGSFQ